MRLSEVKGDRVFDVIADCIDPIANIAADPAAQEFLRRTKLPEGADATTYIVDRIRRHLPLLLRGHKSDFVAILSTIAGVSAEEYAAGMDLKTLLVDCTELLTDEAFLSFFT